MSRPTAAILGALGIGAYLLTVRPHLLHWGASEQEKRRPDPGAELLPESRRASTMAVTIEASPAGVWPWLVQMGCERAGWYSWDRLDNGGTPSADRIHPEWQEISVGDRLLSTPSGRAWFIVAALDPGRKLVLRAPLDLAGRPFDLDGPPPRFYSDSTWSFVLDELPDRRTRLITTARARSHPRLLFELGNVLFWDAAHWIMQTRQLANIKRRAEAVADGAVPDPDGSPAA